MICMIIFITIPVFLFVKDIMEFSNFVEEDNKK